MQNNIITILNFLLLLFFILPVGSRVTDVSGVDVVFLYPLDSAQKPHLNEITHARQMGAYDALDDYFC